MAVMKPESSAVSTMHVYCNHLKALFASIIIMETMTSSAKIDYSIEQQLAGGLHIILDSVTCLFVIIMLDVTVFRISVYGLQL